MFQQGANPGAGGVTRGRGDAPLTQGAETPHGSDAFEARRLDPAQVADMEQLRLLGVGSTTPTALEDGEAAGRAALEASAGSAAWRRRVAPRHRHAVGTFFGGDGDRR